MSLFVNVAKAQSIGDIEPPSVTIRIEVPIEEPISMELACLHFEGDAKAIADALCASLPGGTLCQLTVELLRRKATSLVVPR